MKADEMAGSCSLMGDMHTEFCRKIGKEDIVLRLRHMKEGNIKMSLKNFEYGGVDWIDLSR